jgi:hypothetical protein
MLTISLANVLVLNDDSLTPWTNVSLVGVPGVTTYNNKTDIPPAILAKSSLSEFISSMNDLTLNLTFNYDYAVGILKYECFSF